MVFGSVWNGFVCRYFFFFSSVPRILRSFRLDSTRGVKKSIWYDSTKMVSEKQRKQDKYSRLLNYERAKKKKKT